MSSLLFAYAFLGPPPTLALHSNHNNIGPHPFRFQDIWSHHSDFLNFIRACWTVPTSAANPALRLVAKLKSLKGHLKSWNINVFRNVSETRRATEDLDSTQQWISTDGDSDEL